MTFVLPARSRRLPRQLNWKQCGLSLYLRRQPRLSRIVLERIRNLAETAMMGYETLGSFLEQRLSPAMRTCKDRSGGKPVTQAVARHDQLRTWVDLELGSSSEVA